MFKQQAGVIVRPSASIGRCSLQSIERWIID
jgi:hypothetical protein